MNQPTKCPCCGAAIATTAGTSDGVSTQFACGALSVNGTPPVRSICCRVRRAAMLERFVKDVRATPGDVLSLLERLAEVTR